MKDHLDQLEAESIYIFREAFHAVKPLGMLWSFGKDSNVMIWLAKKAFLGHIPFPLIHCDTELEYPEVYDFRDRYEKEWNIHLIRHICPPLEATDPTLPPAARVAARKTEGLKQVIDTYDFHGIIAGIRRDEEPTRAKERIFSPRAAEGKWKVKEQPPELWDQYTNYCPEGCHLRIHPLLHWTELDIWRYVQREHIPVCNLYFAKPNPNDGNKLYRFRSLGEQGITFPVESTAQTIQEIIEELKNTNVPERAGRAMDHETEDAFERLRASGYM
jgi:sulfate adenylyltransferase subunit 2